MSNAAYRRTSVGMAFCHFFAAVRGRPLTMDEFMEAMAYGDDFLYKDDCISQEQEEKMHLEKKKK